MIDRRGSTPYLDYFGYCRVSSNEQAKGYSLENQVEELKLAGVPLKNISREIATATGDVTLETRPVLYKLIKDLTAGQSLFITKLDRCSRNTISYLMLKNKLELKGVKLIILDLPSVETSDRATAQLMETTLSAIAEFENSRRKDRQLQGIRAAKKEGKFKGRKTIINQRMINTVEKLKDKGVSVTYIAKGVGISRGTVYKILKNHLGYTSNRLVDPKKHLKNKNSDDENS